MFSKRFERGEAPLRKILPSPLMKGRGIKGEGLAFRAEVGAAVADSDAFNGGAADGAEVTTKAVGNLKVKVGCARFPAGTEVGIHAGSFITNG